MIGAGTMGGGIAMNFANAGIPVKVLELKQEALDRGLGTVRKNYENTMKKGKLTQDKFDQRVGLISGTTSYDDIRDADIVDRGGVRGDGRQGSGVQEARRGDEAGRDPGLEHVDARRQQDRRRSRSGPQDVIGTHFFSPANVMKLLEVVRGDKTGKDVLATTMQLSKKLKKTGVVSGVCDGFIGNRMIEQYSRQAGFLLEEGALPEQVDKAVEKFGFAMGPFRMGDLAGNDIGYAIRKRRYVEKPHMTYSKTADLLVEMGRHGQKTGAGWYDYKPGNRTPIPNAKVNEMIVEESKRLGITRRKISDQEIVERLVFALVNEGAQILDEKIAQRASDIDMVYLTGYGFPVWRGGPMLYADTVGLQKVVMKMEQFAQGAERRAARQLVEAGAVAREARGRRQDVQLTHVRGAARRGSSKDFSDVFYDRSRHRFHRPHRPRQVVEGRLQHDARRDDGRARRQARDRAREDRPGRGRRRRDGLRQPRRRDRLEHRAADRARGRLPGHDVRHDDQPLLLVGPADDRDGRATRDRRRRRHLRRRRRRVDLVRAERDEHAHDRATRT